MNDIDSFWSGGNNPEVKNSLSGFDFKNLEPIFSYSEGLPEDFSSEEETGEQTREDDTNAKIEKIKKDISDTLGKEVDPKDIEKAVQSLINKE